MRCLSCGAEMRLVQSMPHESIPLLEHKTFECSACKDIERRLMLSRDVGGSPEGLVPMHEAPPTASASVTEDSVSDADQALLCNAWAMLKGRPSGA